LPREKRKHVYATYGFCRHVDDLGDEAGGNRSLLLDEWERDLRLCYSGQPRHPILVALQNTIRTFDIPCEPLLKLIEANRMDQRQHRYPTYRDVLHYCDHSANPVGRIVLCLFGYKDEERQHLSDWTCTALQLTNFWQDVSRDHRKGRIYIPYEDMQRFNYTEQELVHGIANNNFKMLMQFEVDRTVELFRKGAPLIDKVKGPFKVDLALFTLGGLAVLKLIRQRDYDVLSHRPSLSHGHKAWLLISTLARMHLGLGVQRI
jgi:squalene synthase HpnC